METRTCQNCKKDFVSNADDLIFYKQVKVPPPTFCPECRMQRRYAWRNERSLYKAVCGLCKKNLLAAYPEERMHDVYCRDCWYGDNWDPMTYGQDIDWSRPFLDQVREILEQMPKVNMFQRNSTNSEYANILDGAKNAYLSYSVVGAEDVLYSKNIDASRQIFDSLCVSNSERLAYTVYADGGYDLVHCHQARACLSSAFLFDCINTSHSFMSANLRNQKYVFRNQQCSKEEYEAKLAEIDFENYAVWQALVAEFEDMKRAAIHRFADMIKCVNTTGDALTNMKNCHDCFEAYEEEDARWASRSFQNKNVYDVSNVLRSEYMYECMNITNSSRLVACTVTISATNDSQYCAWSSGEYLFGCVGMRDKKYCILNKQYTEEEYAELLPKIIEHMNTLPYVGTGGRMYRYGEFFPAEFAPFAYNDSIAQEQFPLSAEEIERLGYRYHAPEEKHHQVTIKPEDLPNSLGEVSDNILKEVIGCEHAGSSCLHQCTTAFRITADELAMYRRFHLPLPRACPNCRHYKRLEYRKPWKLWHRACMCEQAGHTHIGKCQNEFETPYAPERPEMVYCEGCYQQEVA